MSVSKDTFADIYLKILMFASINQSIGMQIFVKCSEEFKIGRSSDIDQKEILSIETRTDFTSVVR